MSATRYVVGETYYFAKVNFTPSEARFSPLFYPGKDVLQNIDVVVLKCTEHHKVPGEWEDTLRYDGFLFEQVNDLKIGKVAYKGATWANQYPRAAYGQLDDSADRSVSVHLDASKNTKEYVATLSMEEVDACVVSGFSEALNMLGNVKLAIDGPNTELRKIRLELNEADEAKFRDYLSKFEAVIEAASGMKVVYEELIVQFKGEEPKAFTDYWGAKLVPVVSADSGRYKVDMDTPFAGV